MTKNNILQAQKAAIALPQPQFQSNFRQRILVAEDGPDMRRLNTEVLASSGYEVDAAEDGAAAWDALQLDNYDLLITDHGMPKVTGIELLQKLYDSSLKLPIIMATGTLPEDQLARHPWLEIKAVLLKPYTFDELLETVKHVLHTTVHEPAHDLQQVAPLPQWRGQPSADLQLCWGSSSVQFRLRTHALFCKSKPVTVDFLVG